MKPDPFIAASGHANGESAVARRTRRLGVAACARAVYTRAVGGIAPRRSSTGFTLTEVLIALALISFMLVGISRIFSMTSSTISTGQGVSSALRQHRAVGQSLSTAFLGYSASGDIDRSDDSSGMLPLVIPESSSRGAPFLMINNFRTPTFRSAEAARTAFSQPVASDTYATQSLKTRQVDLNGDGAINPASTGAGGEVIPLYYYGERNFRTDTISFFGQGNFRSQTGSAGTFVSDIRSTECWYWYGHCRVFNGEIANSHLSQTYGSPGDIETSGNRPNPNHRYANQFILGHMQGLLIEPQYAGGSSTGDKTVLTGGGEPVYFLGRRWNEPTDATITGGSERNDVLTPFYYNSGGFGGSYVQRYNPGTGTNYAVNFQNEAATGSAAANDRTLTYHTRTDIIGSGVESLRQRVRFLESIRPRNDNVDWWTTIYTNWNERLWTNPFTSSLSADPTQALARRVPLLAEGCSQFIVEYAGDFITQDPLTGARAMLPAGALPDGELDFAMVNGVKQVRWYGMPRDVDGNGVILGNAGAVPSQAIMESPDVIYLRDIRGGVSSFERPSSVNPSVVPMPKALTRYDNVVAEGAVTDGDVNLMRQNASRYTCAWGASEFETPVVTLPDGRELYDVPQMIRIIVEISDQKGRLGEPVTQEYVFPVKVKG